MASKYWIKLYHEILDDHKMGMLPDHLYRRVIELFLLAGEFERDGELPSLDAMAWRLRVEPESLQSDLELLKQKRIVSLQGDTWIVTKFAERQAPVSGKERVQRFRDREKQDKYYGNANETNRYTDTDTDIDIESDEDTDSDLFKACQKIYETKKGYLISDGQAFTLMINNFKKLGVTAQDYAAAIDAMDADPRYKGSKPTSYETWAIGYADKRKNPAKYSKDKKNREMAEKLDPDTYKKDWGK